MRAQLSAQLAQLADEYLADESWSCDDAGAPVLAPRENVPPGTAPIESVTNKPGGGQAYLLSPFPYPEELDALRNTADFSGLSKGNYRVTAYHLGSTVFFADRATVFDGDTVDPQTWARRDPFDAKLRVDAKPSTLAEQIPFYPPDLIGGDSETLTRSLAPYHLVTFQLVPDPEINALGALAIIEKEPPNAADTGG